MIEALHLHSILDDYQYIGEKAILRSTTKNLSSSKKSSLHLSMIRIQHVFEYILIKAAFFSVCKMPLPIGLWCGRGIGSIFFKVLKIRRNVAIDNISKSFPKKTKKEILEIAHNNYKIFGQNLIEFIREPKLNSKNILKYILFEDFELMDRLFKQDTGVIILTGHFGNWEIMVAALSLIWGDINAVVRQQKNPFIEDLILTHRNAVGINILPLGMAIRGVLKALNNHQAVIMLSDQDARKKGIFVDFLGRPSSVAQGTAIFCLKTKSPILFLAAIRQPGGKHLIRCKLVKSDDLDGASGDNIKNLTQRHAKVLEEAIKEHPDHWFWMHKRWKTKPPVN